MPQIKSQFTPEQKKAFEENTNLGVYNHESLIELLMRQQEQIDEIARNINVEIGKFGTSTFGFDTLYNIWNNK